ncbi:MAG: bifunctional folylpolyglutamate synthase/dihydrofolate synthase [Rickettsiales bacterium]|nr:bifunctional folylpolyglutamate synthase/dihydrofolate synthase [Rickettsiales bacterium]
MSDSAELDGILNSLMHPDLKAIDLSLDRMHSLLTAMGNPEKRIPPVIHVAGTNGKGSTLAFLRAILEAVGYSVHVYTSPHLVHFRERFVVAGKEISDEALLPSLKTLHALTQEHPATFFESTTALAFELFAETLADFTLLEVGLGGRLDATNVIDSPLACAITSIGMDHMEYLGDSLEEIAAEKAAIIKSGAPVFVSDQDSDVLSVVKHKASEVHADLQIVMPLDANVPLALEGEHQRANAALAVEIANYIADQGYHISAESIANGLRHAHWPARLMRLTHGNLVDLLPDNSMLWLDGGHNAAAAEAVRGWAERLEGDIYLICGMVSRKTAEGYLGPLKGVVSHCVTVDIENEAETMSKADIHRAASNMGMSVQMADSLEDAVKVCIERFKVPKNHIIIAGSLYLAGNVLENNG